MNFRARMAAAAATTAVVCGVLMPTSAISATRTTKASKKATTTKPAPTTVATTTAATAPKAQAPKSPIKLMLITALSGVPSFPSAPLGAKAAADSINAKGGVDGRLIELISCDTKNDPNQAAACARRAADEKVVAVVGSFDRTDTVTLPLLEKANIAFLGSIPFAPISFQSPISFQYDGGVEITQYAAIDQAASLGCRSVTHFVTPQTSKETLAQADAAATKRRILYEVVLVSVGQVDINGPLNEAIRNRSDCAIFVGFAPDNARFILALKRTGSSMKWITARGSMDAILPSLGAQADGVFLSGTTLLPTDPALQLYRDDLKASVGEKDALANYNTFSQISWASVYLVKTLTTGMAEVTNETMLAKLKTAKVDVPVARAGIDFGKLRGSEILPRMFNTTVRYLRIKDGKMEEIDNVWHDIDDIVP